MEIDKATKLEKREQKREPIFRDIVAGSGQSSHEAEESVRGLCEGEETNQPPSVRAAHPFSAHPWLTNTLPRGDHLRDKLYRATPRQGSKYRIYNPPLPRHLLLQG